MGIAVDNLTDISVKVKLSSSHPRTSVDFRGMEGFSLLLCGNQEFFQKSNAAGNI